MMALMPLLNFIKIMKRVIFIKVVDKNLGFHQQCRILYHGDKVSLGIQGGKINVDLEFANVYFDWGFTLETLNDCLSKICAVLQSNNPNVTNIKTTIQNLTFGSGDTITKADAIIEYDLIEQ
jgi:hypothetical protein